MSQDLAGTDVVGAGGDLGQPIGQSLFNQGEDRQSTGVIGASEGFSWAQGRLGNDHTNTSRPPPDLPPRSNERIVEDYVIGNEDDSDEIDYDDLDRLFGTDDRERSNSGFRSQVHGIRGFQNVLIDRFGNPGRPKQRL
eukprot:12905273-Prorocentrum_lima.AAC.1